MSEFQELKRSWTFDEAEAHLISRIDAIYASFQARAEAIPLECPDFARRCSQLQREAEQAAEPLLRMLIRLRSTQVMPPIVIPLEGFRCEKTRSA